MFLINGNNQYDHMQSPGMMQDWPAPDEKIEGQTHCEPWTTLRIASYLFTWQSQYKFCDVEAACMCQPACCDPRPTSSSIRAVGKGIRLCWFGLQPVMVTVLRFDWKWHGMYVKRFQHTWDLSTPLCLPCGFEVACSHGQSEVRVSRGTYMHCKVYVGPRQIKHYHIRMFWWGQGFFQTPRSCTQSTIKSMGCTDAHPCVQTWVHTAEGLKLSW